VVSFSLGESCHGYECTLGDHRAGITLIDRLPETGAELSSALPGSSDECVVFEECKLAAAIVNSFPRIANEIKLQTKVKQRHRG
jgi:hypothetical protein